MHKHRIVTSWQSWGSTSVEPHFLLNQSPGTQLEDSVKFSLRQLLEKFVWFLTKIYINYIYLIFVLTLAFWEEAKFADLGTDFCLKTASLSYLIADWTLQYRNSNVAQWCIIRLTCSYPELTKDHVLTSAYVIIFRTVARNAVNKSAWRKKNCSWLPFNKHAMNIFI